LCPSSCTKTEAFFRTLRPGVLSGPGAQEVITAKFASALYFKSKEVTYLDFINYYYPNSLVYYKARAREDSVYLAEF